MSETRRERALFAARLHVGAGTLLSEQGLHDIAAELLATREEADQVAANNEHLRVVVGAVEWAGPFDSRCPWCRCLPSEGHAIDCLAFTTKGEVR